MKLGRNAVIILTLIMVYLLINNIDRIKKYIKKDYILLFLLEWLIPIKSQLLHHDLLL